VLDWASLLADNVSPDDTSYQHRNLLVTWAGVGGATKYESNTDCSGLVNAVIKQTYGLSDESLAEKLGERRPVAAGYYDRIVEGKNFSRISRVQDLSESDLLVIKYENPAPGDNTGHIMIVAGKPQRRDSSRPLVEGTVQWAVPVIDSSESFHGPEDSRRNPDGTSREGIGRGTIRLYTSSDGSIAGYTWSESTASEFYGKGSRPIAAGRFIPG
jgi:hypothetical protein